MRSFQLRASLMERPRRVAAAAALVVTLFAGPASAQQPPPAQAAVNPSADAFVFAGEPNSNYGGGGVLAVSDPARPQGEYQALMRFDLSAAKSAFDAQFGAGGWVLESAALRLNTSTPNNPIFNANAAGPFDVSWMQNDSWAEGSGTPTTPAADGVTFNSLPSFLGAQDQSLGSFNFPGGGSGPNTYTLDVSPGFAADAADGGLLSLRLFTGPGDSVSYTFNSRTFQTAANRPLLTLTAAAVPEPAAAAGALVVASAAALAGRRRRG